MQKKVIKQAFWLVNEQRSSQIANQIFCFQIKRAPWMAQSTFSLDCVIIKITWGLARAQNWEESSESVKLKTSFTHIFSCILLIGNHTCEFFKKRNCTRRSGSCNFSFLKNSLVQINSKLNSKPYDYIYKQVPQKSMWCNSIPVIDSMLSWLNLFRKSSHLLSWGDFFNSLNARWPKI